VRQDGWKRVRLIFFTILVMLDVDLPDRPHQRVVRIKSASSRLVAFSKVNGVRARNDRDTIYGIAMVQ